MKPLRFAVLGTGFWARYQLSAWRELEGAVCVALCDRDRARADALAREFKVERVYDSAQTLFETETLDFADIISSVESHRELVELSARHSVAAICQKPMASTLSDARAMVETCREASVPFFVHENWRWQTPLRALQAVLQSGEIGRVFRARLQFSCSFPVFDNQPFLRELAQFIVTDIGSHVLDVARWLFGEAQTVYCQASRVHPDIKGEDVATVMMQMNGATVACEMSYASRLEGERFPQTFAVVEGARGSVELATDYWLRVTTENGTRSLRVPPPRYAWADPAYDVVHASIVDCNANLLGALRGEVEAETTGDDNLRTVELVFASYESARSGEVVRL